jgi:hypothetical protein
MIRIRAGVRAQADAQKPSTRCCPAELFKNVLAICYSWNGFLSLPSLPRGEFGSDCWANVIFAENVRDPAVHEPCQSLDHRIFEVIGFVAV